MTDFVGPLQQTIDLLSWSQTLKCFQVDCAVINWVSCLPSFLPCLIHTCMEYTGTAACRVISAQCSVLLGAPQTVTREFLVPWKAPRQWPIKCRPFLWEGANHSESSKAIWEMFSTKYWFDGHDWTLTTLGVRPSNVSLITLELCGNEARAPVARTIE